MTNNRKGAQSNNPLTGPVKTKDAGTIRPPSTTPNQGINKPPSGGSSGSKK